MSKGTKGKARRHRTSTYAILSRPEILAGADIAVKVKVTCPSACDLRGGRVRLVSKNPTVSRDAELTTFDGESSQTDEVMLKAPSKTGDYTWKVAFPAQRAGKARHPGSSAPFSFTVKAHPISMRVLDFPDPVPVGEEFAVRVGAKCPVGCELSKRELQVYNALGTSVGTGAVGEGRLPDGSGFWLAELKLKAPDLAGRARWTVRLSRSDLEPPHDESSAFFDFGIGGRPDLMITVEVTDRETHAPVGGAQVLLRPTVYRGYAYSTFTNEAGLARISLGEEEYQLYVSKNGKEYFLPVVDVAGNMTIKAEISEPAPQSWG